MAKSKVKETGAAARSDPKSYNLDTGVKNVIEIDGLKIHVDSRVYLLLKLMQQDQKVRAKAQAKK